MKSLCKEIKRDVQGDHLDIVRTSQNLHCTFRLGWNLILKSRRDARCFPNSSSIVRNIILVKSWRLRCFKNTDSENNCLRKYFKQKLFD